MQPNIDRRPDPFENDEPDAEIPVRTLRGLVADLRSIADILKALNLDSGELRRAATLPVLASQVRDIAAGLDGFL